MGTENHGGAVRHLVEFVDEHRAALAQALDHVTIVHHLVTHIDGRPEQFQGALDNVDGPVDTGTETAGIGEKYLHGHGIIRHWGWVISDVLKIHRKDAKGAKKNNYSPQRRRGRRERKNQKTQLLLKTLSRLSRNQNNQCACLLLTNKPPLTQGEGLYCL